MQFIKNLLAEQRRRMVASLMQHIEAHVYPHLPERERVELRQKVLTTTSAYHDICLDVLKSSVSDGSVVNEEAMRVLGRLDSGLHEVRRQLNAR